MGGVGWCACLFFSRSSDQRARKAWLPKTTPRVILAPSGSAALERARDLLRWRPHSCTPPRVMAPRYQGGWRRKGRGISGIPLATFLDPSFSFTGEALEEG